MPGERVLCEECHRISVTVFPDSTAARVAMDGHTEETGHEIMGVVTDGTIGEMVWEAYAGSAPGSFVIEALAGIDETG